LNRLKVNNKNSQIILGLTQVGWQVENCRV
jgi:hypothetical protein